ncbi:hypothetical protein EV174_003693 [Coemansia sp. RSA 2320]|nr:hypothetical protein EV174_003693 [Coemansia sp. RSA 2320]
MSPRYGRRTSSAHSPHNAAATSAGRRLAFDTTARLSDASDLHVFDGLIDGFSPIKKAPLPEEDDDDDEKLEDRLNDKGSDSEVFDIDALLAKPSKLSPSSKLYIDGFELAEEAV